MTSIPSISATRPITAYSAQQKGCDTEYADNSSLPNGGKGAANAQKGKFAGSLSTEEKAVVEKLKSTDAAVRAHERAHMAAGGQYVKGGASYSYQTGPDGGRYAVSGEVPIDVSEIPNNPNATIKKMEAIRRAALAPVDPSAQDRAVAAQASQKIMNARQELAKVKSGSSGVSQENEAVSTEMTGYNAKGASIPFGLQPSPIIDLII